MVNYDQINVLRKTNSQGSDENVRLMEESRIQGRYHLELAISSLRHAYKNKFPDSNQTARLLEAVHIVLVESHKVYLNPPVPTEKEVAARVQGALETIAAEFR